jgi:hypothetical protein
MDKIKKKYGDPEPNQDLRPGTGFRLILANQVNARQSQSSCHKERAI